MDLPHTVVFHGNPLVAGETAGEVLASTEPLSFWGGYDQHTGEIIDRRHPLSGRVAAEKILVLPFTRGSSTTTSVLLESIKNGKAPAAIIVSRVDPAISLASIIADVMYSLPLPILTVTPEDMEFLKTGQRIRILRNGSTIIESSLP